MGFVFPVIKAGRALQSKGAYTMVSRKQKGKFCTLHPPMPFLPPNKSLELLDGLRHVKDRYSLLI